MINIRQGIFETNSSSMHSIAIRKQSSVDFEEIKKQDDHWKSMVEYFKSCGREADCEGVGYKWVMEGDNSFQRYPFRALTSLFDKALYVIASKEGYNTKCYSDAKGKAIEENLPDIVKEIYGIIRKYIPTFKGFEFPCKWNPRLTVKDDESGVIYTPADWEVHCEFGKRSRDENKYYLQNKNEKRIPLMMSSKDLIGVLDFGDIDRQSSGLFEYFMNTHNVSLEEFLTDSRYVIFIDGDEYGYVNQFIDSGLFHKDDFEEIVTGGDD